MEALFKNLGLSPKEKDVFLKLFELGAQPVSILSKHLHIPRSSTYRILERLIGAGFVEEFPRRGIKYIRTISFEDLEEMIASRQQKLQHTFKLLQSHKPQLEQMGNKLSPTPKVRFFEGRDAVLRMYRELSQYDLFWTFFNPQSLHQKVPEVLDEVGIILKKSGKEGWEILVDTPLSKNYKERFESDVHHICIAPPSLDFPTDTIITPETVYLISYGEQEVSGTEIRNPSIAATQKGIFEILWKSLKQ